MQESQVVFLQDRLLAVQTSSGQWRPYDIQRLRVDDVPRQYVVSNAVQCQFRDHLVALMMELRKYYMLDRQPRGGPRLQKPFAWAGGGRPLPPRAGVLHR
jgi:hypothetical protein